MTRKNGAATETRVRKRPSFWQFYVGNIISLGKEKLVRRELPGYCCWGETEIVQDLFGWKVKMKREEFECGSEIEARYLEIFMHLGWNEVYTPKQPEDYGSFIEELETLKAKADNVIGTGLYRVFAKPQLKFRVRSNVYQDISEIPDDAAVFGERLEPAIDDFETEEELEEAYA